MKEYIITNNSVRDRWYLYTYPEWIFVYQSKDRADVVRHLEALRADERRD